MITIQAIMLGAPICVGLGIVAEEIREQFQKQFDR